MPFAADTHEKFTKGGEGNIIDAKMPEQPLAKDAANRSTPEDTSATTGAYTSSRNDTNQKKESNDTTTTMSSYDLSNISISGMARGGCYSISSRWKAAMGKFRDTVSFVVLLLTRHAALHPVSYIVGILFLSLFLVGVGLATNFNLILSAREYLTPFRSVTREQHEWIVEESGFPARPYSLRLMVHDQGNNVVNWKGVNRTFEVVEAIQAMEGYQELCETAKETNPYGAGGLCHIRGVPMFWNLSLDIAQQQITSDVEVILAVSQKTYPDNSTVDPRELMGHFEYFDNTPFHSGIVKSAESFLMEIQLPAHMEDSEKMAEKGLQTMLDLQEAWRKRDNEAFRLELYLTDYSLESETLRAVFEDVPLIPAVFVIMALFTCFIFSISQKRHGGVGYRQRFLLGFGAVTTVLLSMASSYGLMFIIGVPFTSVTQILPFIMFGIGLDDSFIIFGEFVRTDQKKDLADRVQDTFQEVGLSTFLTTLTTSLAFALGGVTQLPQLYWLAWYAWPTVLIDWLYQITFFVAIIVIDERRIAKRIKNEEQNKSGKCCFGARAAKEEDSQKNFDFATNPFEMSVDTNTSDDGLRMPCPTQDKTWDDIRSAGSSSGDNPNMNAMGQVLDLTARQEGQEHHYHHHLPGPPASAMDKLMRCFADKLLTKYAKIVVLLGSVVLTALLFYSTSLFTQEWNIYEVLTDDSYVASYFRGVETYTDRGFVVPYLYFRNVNQSDTDIQEKMKAFVDDVVEIDSISSRPSFFWLQHFEEFLTYDERLLDLDFKTQLDIFLSVDIFRLLYGDDIVRDPETGDILASRCMIFMDNVDMSEVDGQVGAWRDQLDVTENQTINSAMYHADGYGFNFFLHEKTLLYVWEFYDLLKDELISASIAGVFTVSLVAFMFLPHWTAPVFLIPIMSTLYINMIGFIQLCGVSLNAISHFTLLMSIGLLVDFNMHILLRYYESPCATRDDKVKDALQTMGSSVVVGGLSTLLGVFPLIFSKSDLMKTLFFGFAAMVILGIWFGVIVLPVLLSYCGPLNTTPQSTGVTVDGELPEHEAREEAQPNKSSPSSTCNSMPFSDSMSARQHLDSDDIYGTPSEKGSTTMHPLPRNSEPSCDNVAVYSSPESTPLPTGGDNNIIYDC